MTLHIEPAALSGNLAIMPSKSASHRALLCAALAEGQSTLAPLQLSRDVTATLQGVTALGLAHDVAQACLPEMPGSVRCALTGGGQYQGEAMRQVDCGESGSTLRFLLPLALDGRGLVRFRGAPRLMERPLTPYQHLFTARGMIFHQDALGILAEGTLPPGDYALPGDISSQFITGLLYALPRLPGDSTLRLTTPLESRGYVEMTLEALRQAGVLLTFTDARTIEIPGRQRFAPATYSIPGDWSHAAFFLVGGLLGEKVSLSGLDEGSAQGDRTILGILRQMGGNLAFQDGVLIAEHSVLHGISIDVRDVPDLVPALCVAACAAQGRTRIHGAARLRLKESDRLQAMTAELRKLGAIVREEPDALEIDGGKPLHSAIVDSHNDHRIAMALSIASVLCEGGPTLTGAEAVQKSAPHFFEEFETLGGSAHAGHLES